MGVAVAIPAADSRDRGPARHQWSRALTDAPAEVIVVDSVDDGSDDPVAHDYAISVLVTLEALRATAGTRLNIHAGGVADGSGRALAVIGESGSGKTTAIRTLATRLGYLSDETVSLTDDLTVHPAPQAAVGDRRSRAAAAQGKRLPRRRRPALAPGAGDPAPGRAAASRSRDPRPRADQHGRGDGRDRAPDLVAHPARASSAHAWPARSTGAVAPSGCTTTRSPTTSTSSSTCSPPSPSRPSRPSITRRWHHPGHRGRPVVAERVARCRAVRRRAGRHGRGFRPPARRARDDHLARAGRPGGDACRSWTPRWPSTARTRRPVPWSRRPWPAWSGVGSSSPRPLPGRVVTRVTSGHDRRTHPAHRRGRRAAQARARDRRQGAGPAVRRGRGDRDLPARRVPTARGRRDPGPALPRGVRRRRPALRGLPPGARGDRGRVVVGRRRRLGARAVLLRALHRRHGGAEGAVAARDARRARCSAPTASPRRTPAPTRQR